MAETAATPERKVALVSGITGQDGSYLTELLLSKGYEVHGIMRRSSSFNTGRIDHLYSDPHKSGVKLKLHYGDMCDSTNLVMILVEVKPTEIYHLAAQSHVKVSFELPEYTSNVDGLGTLRFLDAMKTAGIDKTCRFYQASTSELYGLVREVPQDENTPFYPRSPYAVAKQFAYWAVVNYREAYGLHASNGILFNHESPRRGATFVTRKITRHVARVASGSQDILYLGNLKAQRDWGHSRDYVYAMWLILQQPKPDDYVIATGHTRSVKEFVEAAYKEIGIKIKWVGEDLNEMGIDEVTGKVHVKVDPKYFRPTEVDLLLGNPAKAKRVLGWEPTTTFDQLVHEMVEHDIMLAKKGDNFS